MFVSFFWYFFLYVSTTFYNLVSIEYEVDDFEPNRTQILWCENFVVPLFLPPLFLSCDASGFPDPKIRWEKSGVTLSHTKELNIFNSNRNYAGEYVCIASNGVRQEKTLRAYVTVQCKSFFQYVIKSCHCCWIHDTLEPILSSTILNGYRVFNGQLSKFPIFFSLINVIFTSF